MAQETTDFKALKARFQEEELLLRQPRMKPALPEKPKVVPPPSSSTYCLPAGARPSLLTFINQSLDGTPSIAPRVVFKDEKKPFFKTTSMDKNEGKLKIGKDIVTKGNKEPLDENSLYHMLKKDDSKNKKPQLVTPKDLVSASAPSTVLDSKKKGFSGLKWPAKTHLDNVPTDPILDIPTLDGPVLAPLIPIPPEFDDVKPNPEIVPPNLFSSPDSDITVPLSPGFSPSPTFIPAPYFPSLESETPPETESPTIPISVLDLIPPPEVPSPMRSSPESQYGSLGGVAPISIEAMLKPRTPVEDPTAAGSISALSALERAEDLSQVRGSTTADHRIFSALQKARRKSYHNSQTSSSISSTPPPEDFHLPQSPSLSLTDLPLFDSNIQARKHNSINRGQVSPTFEDTNDMAELLDVLPSQPKNVLLDRSNLAIPPKKPAKPVIKTPNIVPPPPPRKHYVPPKLPEMPSANEPQFGGVTLDAPSPALAVSHWGNGEYTGPDIPDGENLPHNTHNLHSNGIILTGPKGLQTPGQVPPYQDYSHSSTLPDGQAMGGNQVYNIGSGNYNEDLYSAKRRAKTEVGRKKKGPPKNPYVDATIESNEGNSRASWFGKGDKKSALVSEGLDDKELRKREKQRLEREKKELKEKQERERKEQKEREKRQNEIKKKFKVTGHEEAMYRAKVTVTTKGRKDDLPVQIGDNISIIRTTNCPKGKWLARDFANNYGYVAVDHVELDIKEMLELGRKTSTNPGMSSPVQVDGTRPGSGTNNYSQSNESFSDDSEEWTADDDDGFPSPTSFSYSQPPLRQNHAISMPDMAHADLNVTQQHSRSDIRTSGPNVQGNHEALQKLATFFHSPKEVQPVTRNTQPEPRPVLGSQHTVQRSLTMDFEHPDSLILPPPDLYADDSE